MKNGIKAAAAPAQVGATPGPWLRQDRWISASFTPGQPMIAHIVSDAYRSPEESEANARLIVRAVNSHETLIAALKGLVAYECSGTCYTATQKSEMRDAAMFAARAAIAEGGDK